MAEALGGGAKGRAGCFARGHDLFKLYGFWRVSSYYLSTVVFQGMPKHCCRSCYLRVPPGVLIGMGLVITPLSAPRPFKSLAHPLAASLHLGGRGLVWRFDGGDGASDGGVLVLQKLEPRTGIVRRCAACFTDCRTADQIGRPVLDLGM